MPLFKRRAKTQQAAAFYLISTLGEAPAGYTRLLDSPEVSACINRISAIIASATIYQMENTKHGDKRVKDALSRFVDIDPWPGNGTRTSWMTWIVTQLLGEGDGNAFVLPEVDGDGFSALRPMPGAIVSDLTDGSRVLRYLERPPVRKR